MFAKGKKYVFGPVASRRLGRSLGVDLVPFKTCSYDCVYCQLGRTTCRTIQREEYAPVEEVLRQVQEALAAGPAPDVITLAGSGEPTLHARLGEVLAGIKRMSTLPLVVLTNGSLLWQPEVRRALAVADVVTPDLDAGTESTWRAVCRPADGLEFGLVVEGLRAFAREYRGKLEVEVFLVDGMYDLDAEAVRLAALLSGLPAEVRLNTTARPGTEASAGPVPLSRLAELARLFNPAAGLIPEIKLQPTAGATAVSADTVADLVRRHPATSEEIASALGADPVTIDRLVRQLLNDGRIAERRHQGRVFYEGVA